MGQMLSGQSQQPEQAEDPLPALAALADDIALNPLKVKVTFECLATNDEGSAEDKEDEEDEEGEEEAAFREGKTQSQEQLMRVEVAVPPGIGQHLTTQKTRSHVIVVADRSGSMAGQPWNEVKRALVTIIGDCLLNQNITLDVMIYSGQAQRIHYTERGYESQIAALSASGCTSFNAAMDTVDEIIKQRANEQFSSTQIMFMTDGQDTVSPAAVVSKRMDEWKTTLSTLQQEVTVHTVGFRADHDFQFLQKLSKVGTKPGVFRYCEPGDGPDVLKGIIEELFDYTVYNAGPSVDVEVEMDGGNRIFTPKKLQRHTVQGDIVYTESGEGQSGAGEGQVTVQTEMWVLVRDVATLPVPTVTLNKTVTFNGATNTVTFLCASSSVEKKVMDDLASKAIWGLRILSRNTDTLINKTATAIEEKKNVDILQKNLTRLQNRLSNIQVFGKGISKDTVASLMETVKEIQTKIDTLHGMLARYSRGETASVSILARAHDLRYEAQFKKSRRQRLMDKRAVKNVRAAKADEAKLQDLTVNEAELSQLSEEAVEFFHCTLSQDSVVEILRDTDNKENTIGFGLAVTRPEHVVDNPTSVRLCLVSGTLVSRSSMLDALEYKINLSGHLEAHNGFNFYHGDSLGYATVGVGREPINAWLPLYVCPSHWERVKVILKPSLAYLCTLDPLGFDWGQLDIPFMVLGAMIGQLSDTSVGEHQLQLLFTFLRTCAACVEDFNLTNRFSTIIREFLKEPRGRLKDKIPNLYTLIGYIAALPVTKARQLLGYEDEGRSQDYVPMALWYALLAETLRRAGGSQFKSYSDKEIKTLVDLIVHGRNNSLTMPGKAQEATCTATTTAPSTSATTGKVQEASCSAGSTPTNNTSSSNSLTRDTCSSSISDAASETETTKPSEEASTSSSEVTDSTPAKETRSSETAAATTTAAHFTVMCNSLATQKAADLYIEGVEGGDEESGHKVAESAVARMEFEHNPKMDKDMEVWARAQLNALESKSQAQKVSSVKKRVREWINEGRRLAGLPDLDATESQTQEEEDDQYDCDAVDSSTLEVVAKLLSRLSGSSFPLLSSLPGTMAFLHTWLSRDRCFSQMDGGLPPSQWIEEVKSAVTEVYATMHAYVHQCGQQVSSSGLDTEEVVVVEGERRVTPGRHRHRKAVQDDDDDDIEYDSDDDEDDALKVMKRRQKEHRSLVTLPMILHVLDPCVNKVKVTRAMLCQAVLYSTNVRAKEAANEGRLLDLKDKDAVECTLRNVHKYLVKMTTVDLSNSILWRRANISLLKATNIWAFMGYLMNTYTDRDEGFGQLLSEISGLADGKTVPYVGDKVKVMLTGRWDDRNVLARGNSCMPGKDLSKKLKKVVGEDTWEQIDLCLRGDLKIHVYRESDIPNRHGHCNSNPYIPPALRLKLGMAPL